MRSRRVSSAGAQARVGFRLALACVLIALCGASHAQERDITVAFAAEPTQLDPTTTSAGVDLYFIQLFYEQLLRVNRELERHNWLAEEWRYTPPSDGRPPTVDIELRQGVLFHNGDELTAEDLRYAYERQSDPSLSRNASRWRSVRDVEVTGRYALRMVLEEPDGLLVSLNLGFWAIPRRYYQDVGDAGIQAHPIGTGPWRFVSRRPREEIVLERFDDYWNPEALPRAERLVIKVIPEDTTRVAAFKTGAIDWMDAVPPAQVAAFEGLPGVSVASLPTANNLFLALDAVSANSPLRDARVRRAVAHAVDVDAILKYVLHGQGVRTAQLAPGTLGYDETLRPWAYAPERARQLLAEAGYPRGLSLNCYNLTTPREPYIKEVGETIFAYLTEAGIRCRIVQLEYGAWINLGRVDARPKMDGIASWMWGHGLPGDPSDAWSGHVHTHGGGWGPYSYHSDPELDEAIERMRASMDEGERHDLVRAVAQMKHERVAGGIPTYRPLVTLAWRDSIDFVPWPGAYWREMREIGPARASE